MLRIGRWIVVLVWVGLMVELARSQWPAAAPPSPPGTPGAVEAEDSWMGVYLQGQKVGYSHTRILPLNDGYRFVEQSFLRLSVFDQVETVRVAMEADTGRDFALRSFAATIDSGFGIFAVRGNVEGQTLVLHIGAGAGDTEQRIQLAEPIFLPASARAHLRAEPLREGRAFTLSVFDPTSMSHRPLEIRVGGRERIDAGGQPVAAWKLRETFHGMESSVWIDDAGRTLREEGPLGMTIEREDRARAVGSGWGDSAFDLLGAVAVPVREPIPEPRNLQRLVARVGGLGRLAVPSDARQSLRGGVLRVERERVAASGTLPDSGGSWGSELAATPFLQVDDPRIRAAAREISGGENDPRLVAERLREWVYRNVEKRPVPSVPSAVQVLEGRVGDCNEHAVLFAALARAAGIPTRVVAGLVYADGAFLYHAWDEVWLGSGWVSVDPTFDQMPADATHVKLVEGGPEAHAELMSVIGNISVDVLEAGGAPKQDAKPG